MNPPNYQRRGKGTKRNYDPAYEGYSTAMNTTPLLKNPDSARLLGKASGIGVADSFRYVAIKGASMKQIKKEEERLRQERRLAELEQ